MPVSSAICDMVTERRPCCATSAAVISSMASRTPRRWASMVWCQSLGITPGYATLSAEARYILCRHSVSIQASFFERPKGSIAAN